MALDFQHHIDELFNFGGGRRRRAADKVSITISRETRKLAGFTDEEIDRLIKAASAGAALVVRPLRAVIIEHCPGTF